MRQLLPEWHPQWGVLLAWPDAHTDWADALEETQRCYQALLGAILGHEHVLLVCRDAQSVETVRERLRAADISLDRLHTVIAEYDDTWARDFGPITVRQDGQPLLLDFRFTGWGGKFSSTSDDALNAALPWSAQRQAVDLVLEGGAIDTDGRGTLLTTRACLLNPNRNPSFTAAELEACLKKQLGVERIWWLEHGYLEGDDTDAHVDTLARFVNENTLAYVQCRDHDDEHYPALAAMERELQALASAHGLTLVALPMVVPQYNAEGERLPATYANFLITNQAILVPTYQCATDAAALDALGAVAGERRVVAVPCRALIEQHGSLHCVTMQLPKGVVDQTFNRE